MVEHLQQDCEGMKHKCDETLNRVILYLDGELSSADGQELLAALEDCTHCFEKYNIEKGFKEFVSKNMNKKACAEALKAEIKKQIHIQAGNA